MATYNNKYTAFNATTTPNTVVGPNPSRRGLKIQVYGPPDVNSGITVWVDTTGNAAVALACWQVISGAVWEWGEMSPKEFNHPQSMNRPNCPVGPISVVTSQSNAQGVIEELT